ncbi:MAG: ABC transporter permease [Eubacterium sp.]|nr:ABC transporter permease [Eubacterium sp.]
MNICKNLFIETKKQKRRFNFLILVGTILAEIFFIYGNYHTKAGAEDGWLILFYSLPIMNCLFLPVVMAGLASRLMDVEHKGDMLKSLYTFSTPKKIFFTKYIYGTIMILALIALQIMALYKCAHMLDFPTNFPIKYVFILGFNTFATSMTLFTIHMILSFFIKNQAASISVGILGSFIGLFSAFLPVSFFQKLLPWGTFASSLFIGYDWNRETRETFWFLLKPDFSSSLICIGWIIVLIFAALRLLNKAAVEEREARELSNGKSKSIFIHKRPTEILKLKGSPAWIAFFIAPVISAVIGTINYTNNLEILTNGWISLWTQHTLFLSYFFMPIIIGIFVGCIWRVDHTGTNMNLVMTHRKPMQLILSKYVATCFITTLSIIWIIAIFIFSGLIIHMNSPLPSEIISWLLMGTLGAYVICAFQMFVSLVIRNFILPIIIAFLGSMAGLYCIHIKHPYVTPFSLFDIALNQSEARDVNMGRFMIAAILFIAFFLTLSISYLSKSDVRSNE